MVKRPRLSGRASFLLVLILLCAAAFGTVPRLLTVQGRLKDGAVLAHGDYNLTIYIYNVNSGGTPLWSEQHLNVPVNRGYFSVILGESNPITLPFTTQYWLAIRVNNEAEMTPRLKLTNSSYAFYAIDANVSSSQWTTSGSDIYYNTGNVGIGTTSPLNLLQVRANDATASGVTNLLRLTHDTTGTPAAGLGTGILLTSETSTTEGREMAQIDAIWTTIADATRTSALRFHTLTGAGALTERVRIDGAGNVGIGTSAPAYSLDVSGALRLAPSSAPTGANGVIYYDSSTNKFRCYQNGAWADCISAGGGSSISAGDSSVSVVDPGTGYISFVVDNTERMRLDANLNLLGNIIRNARIVDSNVLIWYYTASTSPQVASSDSVASTTNTSYTLLKSITVPSQISLLANSFNVYMEYSAGGTTPSICPARFQVRRNGIAIGNTYSSTTTSYVSANQNLSEFSPGSTIEIWGAAGMISYYCCVMGESFCEQYCCYGSPVAARVQNFRVRGTLNWIYLPLSSNPIWS